MDNRLTKDALLWAMLHLRKQGDTDLFPRPFEIDAMYEHWDALAERVGSIDLTNHAWQSARNLLIPKDDLSFRLGCQLDPLDSLLFAGLIKEIGQSLEGARIPPGEHCVFSHRFGPSADGRMYDDVDAWHEFWYWSARKAEQATHVLVADVSSFYEQVSHHTIQQELERCGASRSQATAVMNLLKHLSIGVSRGVPVGPHGAHLLAELAMVPVDQYLAVKGLDFCRYSDDIHIFCADEKQARVAAYELANVLGGQKLHLNRGKSRFLSAADFVASANRMMLDSPVNKFEEELLHLIRTRVDDPYAQIKITDLTPADLDKLSESRLTDILESYLDKPEPNYARLRWVLRRLAQIGAPGAVDFVVQRFETLLPCLSEIGVYLRSAADNYRGDWVAIGGKLLKDLALPIVKVNEYLQVVVLGLFSRMGGLDHIGALVNVFPTSGPSARRKIILAAAHANASSWLSSLKQACTGMDSWQRRALLYAARVFSKDERKYWYKRVRSNAGPLDWAVMQYAERAA